MWKIKENIKTSQDRQKIYACRKKTHKQLKVGEHVYMRGKSEKSTLRTGGFAKLEP